MDSDELSEERNSYSDLSPAQFAVLEMTNDPHEKSSAGKLFLTSKSAYSWAVAISTIVSQSLGTEISEPEFNNALQNAINENNEKIKRFYLKANDFRPPFEGELFELLISSLFRQFKIENYSAEEVAAKTQQEYDFLLKQGLIEDPVEYLIAGSIALSVVGFIPTGFTIIKEKGRRTLIEYKSLFLTIKEQKEGTKRTLEVKFRIAQFIKVFKDVFASSVQNLLTKMEEIDKTD